MLLLGKPALMPQGCISFACQIKLSCKQPLTLVCHFKFLLQWDRTEVLHTPPTYLVPFLRFNLAEITLARHLRVGDQEQQKPNSAKLTHWKLNTKKTQCNGWDKKPSVLETGTAKTNSGKAHVAVSDSRTLVKVGGPHPYGWKVIWLTKS